jgi:hypothetical protein
VTLGRILICGLLLGLLVSCANREPKKDRTPSIGQAFVGPTVLNIRQDVNPKTPTVATLKHGDRLDIIESRRRFVKVRTEQGVIGWTDNHQLLMPEQMAGLERQAEEAKRMPSQGAASLFEALNMHADPNRTSPGFEQLKEGAKVDVLEHKLVPRVAPPPPPILAPVPKPKPSRRRSKAEKTKSGKIPPPPMPLAPLPPKNWIEMSRTEDEPDEKGAAVQQADPPKPIPLEDWYLVRTKDGKAGWVLSRMVSMAIPDEVAQYAEGHRITSYFSLGKVDDDGLQKDNWLWTTIQKGSEQYEFDSFRVFVWSRRHHRYETAYIQRDVTGHYPISVDTSGENPSFSLVLDGDDGQPYKKTYVFNGYRVNLVNTERYVPGNLNQPSSTAIAQNQNSETGSWYSRMKDRVSKMFRR